MSPDTSPGSTFCASTSTSSGSTRLTSISLVEGGGNGLLLLLRGVPGVLGRVTSKLLTLLTGEAGTGFNDGFVFVRRRCERDSDESEALNFLIEDIEEWADESDVDESGRFGVNGAGLVGFKGVDDVGAMF
jgi:hypothetical protein